MADYYLRSADGSNADNGSTWALAKADLHTATTGALAVAAAASDRIFVADGHSQSTAAAITLTALGTAAGPTQIIAVDDTADPEPPTTPVSAASAIVATTAGSSITIAGHAHWHGIAFTAGSGGTGSANMTLNGSQTPFGMSFEKCSFEIGHNSSSNVINLGSNSTSIDDQVVRWIDCDVKFAAAGQSVLPRCEFLWQGGSVLLGTAPTALFKPLGGVGGRSLIEGCDLSNVSGALVDVSGASGNLLEFRGCKLHASVAAVTGTNPGPGGTAVHLHWCHSSDGSPRFERHDYSGSAKFDGTLYRNAGATLEWNGATIGWSMICTTSSGASFVWPLRPPDICQYNTATGASKTLTVHYLHDGASALDDDDIWLDVEYFGTAGQLQWSSVSDRKANILSSAAAQETDTAADWDDGLTARANSTAYSLGDIRRAATPNGRAFIVTTAGTSGASEPAAFGTASDGDAVTDNTVTWRCMRREKLTVTFTPQEQGPVTARVKIAKPSITVYVCPEAELS